MGARRRFRELSDGERRTIGFCVGLALVSYWGMTASSPDTIVAGIVGSLICFTSLREKGED